MSTTDLTTVLIKYLGLTAIFWAVQGLIVDQISNSPMAMVGSHGFTASLIRIATGVALIFFAPLIASIIQPKPESSE